MPPADLMFRPIRIGTVEIPNRIVLPSMTTRYATREGFATDETVGYYRARGRGGVGLVTVEMAAPEIAGRHRFHELGIYDDKFLPGLTRIVEAIHAEGRDAPPDMAAPSRSTATGTARLPAIGGHAVGTDGHGHVADRTASHRCTRPLGRWLQPFGQLI